jgi:hypothetical protein
MNFKIDLSQVHDFPELLLRYSDELDDVRSILMDTCDILEDTSAAEFVVSGFGQASWPVDVRTDLAVLLEQIPNAISSIDLGAPFTLDFYEQGLERKIHFTPQGETYSALCESWTAWRPDPSIEIIDTSHLRKMLFDIREGLMNFLSIKAPRVAAHPWMRAWSGARSSGS